MYLGGPEKHYILESHGSGAAFFDHDSDGDLDLYIVNGATFATYRDRSGPATNSIAIAATARLWKSPEKPGSATPAGAGGVAVGDIDNDGRPDLYATNYGANVLYRNRGNDRFADATQAAGVGGDQYSASAAFFDYDRDGDLDLYVANYVVFDAEHLPAEPPLCTFFSGLRVYCGPKGLVGAPDVLYRNEGDGRVLPTSPKRPAWPPPTAITVWGVVPTDYDSDGDSDLFVANDETPNVLFQNQGDGTFQDVALIAGVAYNGGRRCRSWYGRGLWRLRSRRRPRPVRDSLFYRDQYALPQRRRRAFLRRHDHGWPRRATVELLGWGTRFFDYDNDGRLDLFVANGHVYPQVDQAETGTTYRQPNQLFRNEGGGRFAPVSAGPGLAQAKVSRGTSFGDYDDDGDIDLFVVELNGRANSVAQRWRECGELSRGADRRSRGQSRWGRHSHRLASGWQAPVAHGQRRGQLSFAQRLARPLRLGRDAGH